MYLRPAETGLTPYIAKLESLHETPAGGPDGGGAKLAGLRLFYRQVLPGWRGSMGGCVCKGASLEACSEQQKGIEGRAWWARRPSKGIHATLPLATHTRLPVLPPMQLTHAHPATHPHRPACCPAHAFICDPLLSRQAH